MNVFYFSIYNAERPCSVMVKLLNPSRSITFTFGLVPLGNVGTPHTDP